MRNFRPSKVKLKILNPLQSFAKYYSSFIKNLLFISILKENIYDEINAKSIERSCGYNSLKIKNNYYQPASKLNSKNNQIHQNKYAKVLFEHYELYIFNSPFFHYLVNDFDQISVIFFMT